MTALTMTIAGLAACSNSGNQGGGDDVVVVSSETNKSKEGGETSASESSNQADEFDGWSFVYNGLNINVGTDLNIVEKTGKLGVKLMSSISTNGTTVVRINASGVQSVS